MQKKQWRKYSCELGESWEIFIDENQKTTKKDITCSKGHEAVMEKEINPSNYVIVSVIPCANQDEHNPANIYDLDLFQIKIELMNGEDWFAFSQQKYSKVDVIKLSNLFVGLNKYQAERIWKAKKLGDMNTYRHEHSYYDIE